MNRFKFGRNWKEYLDSVGEQDIQAASQDLSKFLGKGSLRGLSFLDIGCGSGIHSLAARRLGASQIVSLDYDAMAVDCVRSLIERDGHPESWRAFRWDVLSTAPFPEPAAFDIVYAWGVLHHTGHMWAAIDHSLPRVKPGGLFFLALYNKHWTSPYWKIIKRTYCMSPKWMQNIWLELYAAWESTKEPIRHRLTGVSPRRARGMKWRQDLRDWLGGYPYEYASAPDVIAFMASRQFTLVRSALNTGTGCSEFLFSRTA
ncbi:MAG TPA: class I SAM-dependent methyltransferase [Elusimicrobiota bacterium]|nr:class I SAM-dependent methyltransferase [Elusimicrobiota bacterium]